MLALFGSGGKYFSGSSNGVWSCGTYSYVPRKGPNGETPWTSMHGLLGNGPTAG